MVIIWSVYAITMVSHMISMWFLWWHIRVITSWSWLLSCCWLNWKNKNRETWTETGWWFGTFYIFPYIGIFIIPIDELIFFRGVGLNHQPAIIWLQILQISWKGLMWTIIQTDLVRCFFTFGMPWFFSTLQWSFLGRKFDIWRFFFSWGLYPI